jgi:phospholipid/cholesterol/gamma-HCH transport system permease protein
LSAQAPDQRRPGRVTTGLARIGRTTVAGLEEIGYAAALLADGLFVLLAGPFRRAPVRFGHVVQQGLEIGVLAVPIVSVLALTIGVMLAIQGIHTLETFGAESQVTTGIALSVTREFGPLITGILVAGRSGAALAARIGTMRISQEIDALRVIGVAPVRYLVAPPLVAMGVMMPLLSFWAIAVGLLGGGVYVSIDLGMSLSAYAIRVTETIALADLLHGLGKSVLFGVAVVLIGAVNGATVTGGAAGVGRATTRAVVQAISAIVVTDMLFVFALTR